jgi:hypothetical protein
LITSAFLTAFMRPPALAPRRGRRTEEEVQREGATRSDRLRLLER